jgi:hypothetical protein
MKNKENVGSENAETSLVFQVLYTWGKKAYVVRVAAISPNTSILFILSNNIYDFSWNNNYFLRNASF